MDSKQVYLQLDISCNHAGPLAIAATFESKGHLGTKSPKHSRYFHISSSILELPFSKEIVPQIKKNIHTFIIFTKKYLIKNIL